MSTKFKFIFFVVFFIFNCPIIPLFYWMIDFSSPTGYTDVI